MAERYQIGDILFYKLRSDDIRKGELVDIWKNAESSYYKFRGCNFYFHPDLVSRTKEKFIKKN